MIIKIRYRTTNNKNNNTNNILPKNVMRDNVIQRTLSYLHQILMPFKSFLSGRVYCLCII